MDRPLIGLVGYKGAGKDSVARVLVEEFGYVRRAFADALKREIADAALREIPPSTSMRYIPLTQGYTAVVDEADYPAVSQYSWSYHDGYARRGYQQGGKTVAALMHRELLNAPPDSRVDHKNGNGLDNRRDNLRLCTDSQNSQNRRSGVNNRTGFKGVSRLPKCRSSYSARITVGDQRLTLGVFSSAEEAAEAYDVAATQFFGEFAQLNGVALRKEHEKRIATFLEYFETHKYDDPGSPTGWPRMLAQAWGVMRRDLFGTDYWAQKIPMLPGVVISDVRFPNEAEAVQLAGGVIWRIARPGCGADGHASESHIKALPFDLQIMNTGTLDDLAKTVRDAMVRVHQAPAPSPAALSGTD